MIILVFQQQGFSVEGIDRFGSDDTLVRLDNISIEGRQRQFLPIFQIFRSYRAVQRQIIHGAKRHIAAGQDGAFHLLFYNISGTVLFLFTAHRQRAVADSSEFFHGIDGSKKQGSVLYALGNTSHAPDIGRPRCNVYRSSVIQNTNSMICIAHNTIRCIRCKHQIFSCVDVGFSNVLIRLVLTHQKAHFALQGNRIPCIHGSQFEYCVLLHVLNVYIFGRSCLCQSPSQGNCQRFV